MADFDSDEFDREIQADDDSDDEFDQKVQESYQQKLAEEAERILKDTHSKVSNKLKKAQKSDRNKRPMSGRLRPQSAYSGAGSKKSVKQRTGLEDLDAQLAFLNQREQALTGETTRKRNFLKETKQKKQTEERELALTVDKCKREFEYDCLHKMGEANEIAQSMNLPTTYRAIRKENGTTQCHIYHNDQFVEEVTLENFLREWRRLKRQQRPAINLPPPSADKDKVVTTTGGAKVNKKERQEELKKLLLETKELTNKLKVQLKILEKKGIISKSMHTSSAAYSSTFF